MTFKSLSLERMQSIVSVSLLTGLLLVAASFPQLVWSENIGSSFHESKKSLFSESASSLQAGRTASTNRPPIAVNDFITVHHTGKSILICLLENDSDPDGDDFGFAPVLPRVKDTTDEFKSKNGVVIKQPAGDPNKFNDDKIKYTPDLGFTGTDTFTYDILDKDGGIASATVNVTVNNSAPVAVTETVTVHAGESVIICLLDNDFDPDGDEFFIFFNTSEPGGIRADFTQNATILNQPAGDPNLFSDDKVKYIPMKGFIGTDIYTYKIEDVGGVSTTGTVTITVTNAPPVAVDDTANTSQNKPVEIDALKNDSDADGDKFVFFLDLDSKPGDEQKFFFTENGTVVIDDNGTPDDLTDDKFIYAPSPDFIGTEIFDYKIVDSNGVVTNASITVNVLAPPVARNDAANFKTGQLDKICILDNDSNADGGTFFIDMDKDNIPDAHRSTFITGPGRVEVHNNGTPNDFSDDKLLYLAGVDFTGVDTFEYTISDGNGGFSTASVAVTIAVNKAPVAVNDSETVELGKSVKICILDNDTDADGDKPFIDMMRDSDPGNQQGFSTDKGTVTIDNNGTPNDFSDDKFVYTPNSDALPTTDTFIYTISDGNGGFSTTTVDVNLIFPPPANNPPTARIDFASVNESESVEICVLENDSDIDHDSFFIDMNGDSIPDMDGDVFTPSFDPNGRIEVSDNGTPNDFSDDKLIYTPKPGFFGTISFEYSISDVRGGSSTGSVNVVILGNQSPIANSDKAAVLKNESMKICVLDNDTDGNGDKLFIDLDHDSKPDNGVEIFTSHGRFSIDDNETPSDPSDDKLLYTPNLNYTGSDTFEYTISDGKDRFSTSTVSVNIFENNSAPVATFDEVVTVKGTSVMIDVLSNDSDVNLDKLTIISVTNGANGSVEILSDGKVKYTPNNSDFTGTDTFTYTISDGNGEISTATVGILITASAIVEIEDSKLEDCIRKALNKPGGNLTQADLEKLTKLDASGKKISSLFGLQFATNLRELDLGYNQFKDLSPLSALTNLFELDLSSNDIADLSALCALTNLVHLRLAFNNISNLSPLRKLTFLNTLNLSHNGISDLHPLSTLHNLDELNLDNNQIMDMSPLNSLSDLKTINLNHNLIGSISPLSNLDKLFILRLEYNFINISEGTEDRTLIDTYIKGEIHVDFTSQNTLINAVDDIVNFSPGSTTTICVSDLLKNDTRSIRREIAGDHEQFLVDIILPLDQNDSGAHQLKNGTLSIVNQGNSNFEDDKLIFKPNEDFTTGSQTFEYTIVDKLGFRSTAIVSILVNNNRPPIAVIDTISIKPNEKDVEICALKNDTDPDGDNIEYVTPLNGTSEQGGTFKSSSTDATKILYTPKTDFIGLDQFSYQIKDGNGGVATGTIKIKVKGDDPVVVNFPDPNLEDRVRRALSKPEGDITSDDMATLTFISIINGNNITNLTGLEYATSLKVLRIPVNNNVTDLSPIAGLPLEEIDIGNGIVDILPLASITTLKTLDLGFNNIVDISPLATLINLTNLSLFNNKIVNIDALGNLINLTELTLNHNSIISSDALKTLINLTSLSMSRNKISSIALLDTLTKLGSLDVDFNFIDISEGSPSKIVIDKLFAANTFINIRYLTQFVDIPNEKFKAFILQKSGKQPTDNLTSTDLLKFTVLGGIDVDLTNLVGILQLKNLTSVRIINSNTNGSTPSQLTPESLALLAQIPKLSIVDLSGVQLTIAHIEALATATQITSLTVTGCGISDISAWSTLINLQSLIINNNLLTNLQVISAMTNLSTLDATNNLIEELTDFSNLTQLSSLGLGNNNLVLIAQLLSITSTNISSIDLDSNYLDLSDGSAAASIKNTLKSRGYFVIANKGSQKTRPNLPDSQLFAAIIAQLAKQGITVQGNVVLPIHLLKLETLDASGKGIKDITGIEGAINLKNLDLSNNDISIIAALDPLTFLVLVNLNNNFLEFPAGSDNETVIGNLENNGTTVEKGSQKVNIPDRNLQDLVRGLLGLPDGIILTKARILTLTSLGFTKFTPAPEFRIKNLVGLECAKNLQEIFLNGHCITDTTPLTELAKLRTLHLDFNKICTLDPLLGKLPLLRELSVDNNKISDLVAVGSFGSLEFLSARGNRITTVGVLSASTKLVNLTRVELDGNFIKLSDADEKAKIKILSDKNITVDTRKQKDAVVDIPDSGLEGAIRDKIKNKSGGEISDSNNSTTSISSSEINAVEPLRQTDLAKIKTLDARFRQIENLKGLEHAFNLETLDLTANNIKNLNGVFDRMNPGNMKTLNISSNPLDLRTGSIDAASIKRLEKNGITVVTSFILTNGSGNVPDALLNDEIIKELAKLGTSTRVIRQSHLDSFNTLDLRSRGLRDLTGLNFASNLTSLNLSNNKLSDLDKIKDLNKLITLDVSRNFLDLSADSPDKLIIENFQNNGTTVIFDNQKKLEAFIDNDGILMVPTSPSKTYQLQIYDAVDGWINEGDPVQGTGRGYHFLSGIRDRKVGLYRFVASD